MGEEVVTLLPPITRPVPANEHSHQAYQSVPPLTLPNNTKLHSAPETSEIELVVYFRSYFPGNFAWSAAKPASVTFSDPMM